MIRPTIKILLTTQDLSRYYCILVTLKCIKHVTTLVDGINFETIFGKCVVFAGGGGGGLMA